jgi:D-serine ammonia-lyase
MDYSLSHHQMYVGKSASELPTPSLVVSLPAVKKNVETLHNDVKELGIRFRPHVKTLKASLWTTHVLPSCRADQNSRSRSRG